MATKWPGHLLPHPVSHDFIDRVASSPHGIDLEVRIWPGKGTSTGPWILWCHGGGYASGSHYAPPSWVVPGFTSRGITIVTAAFRLSPHGSLEDQVEDMTHAYLWSRKNLDSLVPGVQLDDYGVGGDSAGGTLSLLLGLKLSPPPRAVVDVYGNIDLLTKKHWGEVVEASSINWTNKEFSIPQILEECKTRNPANAVAHAPFPWELGNFPEAVTQERWAAPGFQYTDRIRFQTAIKEYMGLSVTSVYYVLGLDRFLTKEEQWEYTKKWSPYYLVSQEKTFPPTAFLHGTEDAAVDIGMAERMAKHLKEIGVPVLESYEPNGPHAFDMIYTGPEVDGWETYITPLIDFVEKHLRG